MSDPDYLEDGDATLLGEDIPPLEEGQWARLLAGAFDPWADVGELLPHAGAAPDDDSASDRESDALAGSTSEDDGFGDARAGDTHDDSTGHDATTAADDPPPGPSDEGQW